MANGRKKPNGGKRDRKGPRDLAEEVSRIERLARRSEGMSAQFSTPRERVAAFGKVLSDPRLTEGERRGALRKFAGRREGRSLGFRSDQALPPRPKSKKRGRRFGPE